MSATGTRKLQPFVPAERESGLRARAHELVERGTRAGADEIEAFARRSDSVTVRFEKGALKLTTVDQSASYGLRVFTDHRQGFSSTNQEGEEAHRDLVQDACALAAFSVPDEANRLPRPGQAGKRLELVDPELADMAIGEVVEAAQDLVQRASALDPRLAIESASLQLTRGSAAVSSSVGTQACESEVALGLSIMGMAVDGDDVGGLDYWGGHVRRPQDLEGLVQETVRRFTSSAIGNLGAGSAETYQGPVLFSPAALLDVFIAPLVSACSAIAVQRDRSAMAGRLGQGVATDTLTVVDDPGRQSLAGAASFDREGTPTRLLPIVDRGKLASYLYNGYAARVDGVESTGHAAGGARSVPGLAPHALCVSGADAGTPEDLMRTLDRGLLVQRFSGSVDPASGDFSGVAKSARWIENGQVVRSVRETLFSGNAFELLGQLLGLSSVPESVMGAALAPWALVDGVSVTAG